MMRKVTKASIGKLHTALAAIAVTVAVVGIGAAPALAREDGHGGFHRGGERHEWHGDRWHRDRDDWRFGFGIAPFAYNVPAYPYPYSYAAPYGYAPPVYSPPAYYYGW